MKKRWSHIEYYSGARNEKKLKQKAWWTVICLRHAQQNEKNLAVGGDIKMLAKRSFHQNMISDEEVYKLQSDNFDLKFDNREQEIEIQRLNETIDRMQKHIDEGWNN